jgi:hypothetical protein
MRRSCELGRRGAVHLRLNLYVASILTLAGVGWFARIQRRSAQDPDRSSIRRGGALLAVAASIVLAECGHSTTNAWSPATTENTQLARTASATGRCDAAASPFDTVAAPRTPEFPRLVSARPSRAAVELTPRHRTDLCTSPRPPLTREVQS